jgi:mono/diheme cytochrome c family protein
MNHRIIRIGSTLLLLVALTLVMSAPAQAQDAASLFKSKCAMCHGPDGGGDTPTGKAMKVRDLRSADVQKQTDAELTAVITNGKNKMPAYKGKLDDGQIKQLVGFVRDLAKKK